MRHITPLLGYYYPVQGICGAKYLCVDCAPTARERASYGDYIRKPIRRALRDPLIDARCASCSAYLGAIPGDTVGNPAEGDPDLHPPESDEYAPSAWMIAVGRVIGDHESLALDDADDRRALYRAMLDALRPFCEPF